MLWYKLWWTESEKSILFVFPWFRLIVSPVSVLDGCLSSVISMTETAWGRKLRNLYLVSLKSQLQLSSLLFSLFTLSISLTGSKLILTGDTRQITGKNCLWLFEASIFVYLALLCYCHTTEHSHTHDTWLQCPQAYLQLYIFAKPRNTWGGGE